MAAEFSRELSEKVFRGKRRLAEMGYWVGGTAGYGYRRLMISADSKPKQVMQFGEQKNLTTDRVILIPGPKEEIEGVKYIFAMAGQGQGCTAIARELNRTNLDLYGKPWRHQDVFNIVTHPKYMGCNVWNRRTQYLQGPERPVDPQNWIVKPGAFAGIADQETFKRAQAMLPRKLDFLWSNREILQKLRRLLASKGRLTEDIILKAKGMPSVNTLAQRFGSRLKAYEAAGYRIENKIKFRLQQSRRTLLLRDTLLDKLRDMFPNHISLRRLPGHQRYLLVIDDTFLISVLLCRKKTRGGRTHWVVEPKIQERGYPTIVCKMDSLHRQIISYHFFPKLGFRAHQSFNDDPWLESGTELDSLAEFYEVITRTIVPTTTQAGGR
jgi:Recombinase